MGRARTIARRSFLIGSAAIAGGVAFGTYMYRRNIDNPLLAGLEPGDVALTPFVKITTRGITLITPRTDMGQGAYSVQAHLIAEELDVDLAEVTLEPGPPSAAYYNSKAAAEALPIAATREGWVGDAAAGVADVVGKLAMLQLTGGSSTVPDMYDRLRVAGAVARETLVAAAVLETGLRRDQLKTENGAVVLPDGSRLTYLSLAGAAASLTPPENVPLRDPSQWRHLGKPHMRTDMVAKSTGTQTYGIDVTMDGMVFAAVRTNPALGGGIRAYDATEAEAMRGVMSVIPITGGIAVVADNTWRAFRAADAVVCDWGPAPYIGDTRAQFEAANASFDGRRNSRLRNDGDVKTTLAGSRPVEVEYRVPYLAHAALEPVNAVVLLTEDRLDVWAGTQIPGYARMHAASVAGLDTEQVHVHAQVLGGSFGRRLEDDFIRQATEIAVAMPGVPIKMTWSREEDFSHTIPRPLAIGRGRGAVAEGRVTVFDLDIAAQSVTASSVSRFGLPYVGPDVVIVAGAWDQPFAIPNYRVTGYRVPEMVPVSSWRSVGASGNGFLHESLFDELCHEAGADPLAERLRLCTHMPSRKVLEAVGEMSNWGSAPVAGRGRGLAFTLSFGVPVAEVVEVSHTPDGLRIDKVFVAADVGRILDPVNFEAQLTGGVIWGLGHAMNCELTYRDGGAEQDNYHLYEGMRFYQTPEIEVRGLEVGDQIRGIGEPAVPPAAPALGNAIFAATGQRIRELPFANHIDFL